MGNLSKGYTFGATETVTNTKLHSLVDSATVTGIVNADIDASANIDSTKLNLASAGYLTSGQATATITGDWTFNGATVFGSDVTFAGQTIADLGTVTTADINGGTIDNVTMGAGTAVTITDMDCNGGSLDGVNIGTTTATGELLVNNASDAADGLGSQGTAGQYLKSAGAGSNPTWGIPVGLSNVIFCWMGSDSGTDNVFGLYRGTSLSPTMSGESVNYLFWGVYNTTYRTIMTAQYEHLAGFSSVKIHAKLWASSAGSGDECYLKVTIGSATAQECKSVTSATPAWYESGTDIDVSGLSDGTKYTITFELKCEAANHAFCSGIILTVT